MNPLSRRRPRRRPAAFALGLLALAPGCGATWLGDRARDFGQVLDLDVAAGGGLRLYGGASHVLDFGWGSTGADHAGLRDGALGTWTEERSEFGIGPLLLHEVDLREGSRGIVGHRTARFAEPGFDPYPLAWEASTDRRPLDLGFGVHLLLGVGIEIRLFEVADALASLFGFDLAWDDVAGRSVEALLADLGSPDARVRRNADRALRIVTGLPSDYPTYSDPSVRTGEQERAIEVWKRAMGGLSRGTEPVRSAPAPRK